MKKNDTPVMHQINNKSLREHILIMLRDAILAGEFKPGQKLVETELASQMGVSRAPIREALQTLNTEGLVEIVPYHGTTVRQLTTTDIEELYSLRIVLESFAVQRIIAQQNPEHIDILQNLYEEMLAAANGQDVVVVSEIDRQFHDTLIELSNHSLLMSTWNSVAMRVRQVMALRNMVNDDIKQIAYNHLPIINAIEKSDEATALKLLQAHIASAGDLLAEDWQAREQEETES